MDGRFDEQYFFQEFYIPRRMEGGICRYVEYGIEPGDFLTAIIRNDLKEAVGRADEENMRNLPAYVAYFYNEVPSPAWGSKEKMEAWMETRQATRDNAPVIDFINFPEDEAHPDPENEVAKAEYREER